MEYPQDLINKAYKLARPHGIGSTLSRIEVIERLTHAGIPADLAEQAANDVLLDRKAEDHRNATRLLTWGVIITCLGGCVLATGFVFDLPFIIIPAAFFVGLILVAAGLWRRHQSR
jgi:hypothetical protein